MLQTKAKYSREDSKENLENIKYLLNLQYGDDACDRLLSIRERMGFDFTAKGFFKKSETTRDYTYIKVNNLTDTVYLSHFLGQQTIALSRFPSTQIYVIDIDKRSQAYEMPMSEIYQKVIDVIGKPFYVEHSTKSDGYHLYYYFGQYINSSAWDNLEKVFRDKYGIILEPKCGVDRLRLPFSVDYRRHLQEDFDTFINAFTNPTKIPTPAILQGGQPIEVLRNTEAGSFDHPDYSYGCGTRVKNQIKIALYCRRHELGESDYLSLCNFYHDGTSKDIRRLGIEKASLPIFKWSGKISISKDLTQSSPNPEDYILHLNYELSNNEYDSITTIFNNHIHNLNSSSNTSIPARVREAKRESDRYINYLLSLRLLYEWIKGKKQFRESRNYRYRYEKYSFLNKGVPLGRDELRKVGKLLGIPNVERYVRVLEEIGLLEKITNDRGYSYSRKGICYVTHYIVHEVDEIESPKKMVVRKFHTFSYKTLDKPQKVYYALLKKRSKRLRNVKKRWIYLHGP